MSIVDVPCSGDTTNYNTRHEKGGRETPRDYYGLPFWGPFFADIILSL
jgi:hypothetical protein